MKIPTKTLRSALTAAGVAAVTGGILVVTGVQREIAGGVAGIAGITAGIAQRRKSKVAREDGENNEEPTEGEVLYGLAASEFEAGNYANAVGLFCQVLELNEESAEVYHLRGYSWGELGQWSEQIEDYSRAIEMGGIDDDLYFSRGVAYFNAELYESAISDFTRSLESRPENTTGALINRGSAFFCLHKHKEARVDFTKALEIETDNADAYYNRARANQESGDLESAISDFNRAIELNEKNFDYLIDRGIAWGQKDESEKAINDFTIALAISPNSYRALWLRGRAQRDLGQLNSAIKDFDKAIEIYPEGVDALRDRGFTYGKAEDYELAINDYSTAINISSEDCVSYYCRAVWKRRSGDIKGALEDLGNAIRLNPEHPNAYTQRAEILFEERKYGDALKDMNNIEVFRLWMSDMKNKIERLERRASAIEELPDEYEKERMRGEWQTESSELSRSLTDNSLWGILVCSETIEKDSGNKVAMINLLRLQEYAGDMEGVALNAAKFRSKIGVETLVYLLIRNDLDDQALELLKNESSGDTATESIMLRLGEQYFALGHSYLRQQQNSKIIRPMTKAIELGISGELLQKAYANRATGYLSTKQHKECIEDIDMFFSMKNYEPLVSLQVRLISDRSFCKQQLGDFEGALVDAKMAVELDRSSVYLNDLGNIQQYMGLLDDAIQSFSEGALMAPGDVFIITNRGNAKSLKGDHLGAIEDYTYAYRKGDLNAQFQRGRCHLERKEYNESTKDFSALIENPDFNQKEWCYFNRAYAEFYKGNFSNALGDCNSALEIDPDYTSASRMRAKIYYQLGEHIKARADYLEVANQGEASFVDFQELGTVEHMLGNHNAAITYLESSLSKNRSKDHAHPLSKEAFIGASYYLSASHYSLENYEDSLGVSRKCEEYHDLSAEYLRLISCVYDDSGDSEKAIETINRALALDNTIPGIWYDRGVIRRDSGDLEGAIADFKQAFALDPSFTSACHNIGSINMDIGNMTQACHYWRMASDLGDQGSKRLVDEYCQTRDDDQA